MTSVITGTAMRAYELAARFRERGVPVVLGGPHVTLIPEDAQPHADAIVVGYAACGVLLALLFFTGYRWAKYTLGHPWIVGLCFLVGGIAMVWTAIMLGG